MNEQQLIIDAKIEKSKIDRVKKAVSRIETKRATARRNIADILEQRELKASLELHC